MKTDLAGLVWNLQGLCRGISFGWKIGGLPKSLGIADLLA